MGVPVLRGGRVLGALVVQNQTLRSYTDEEMETLETTAMVLAELITGRASWTQKRPATTASPKACPSVSKVWR